MKITEVLQWNLGRQTSDKGIIKRRIVTNEKHVINIEKQNKKNRLMTIDKHGRVNFVLNEIFGKKKATEVLNLSLIHI